MIKVLYVVYWGALEQLGQSLVVPAVKKLAQMGVELTLVTFEKPHDLARTDEMTRVRKMLEEDGIEWIPLKYHKDPKIPATVFDITNGLVRSLLKRLRKRYDIVHARTFIGGLIGLALAPLIRSKFVYHNEGFYPDEQVDGGVWTENSRPHRVAKRLENTLYLRADGIIALSYRSKVILDERLAANGKQTPVIVVPSCVDLGHFKLKERESNNGIVFVYLGSVGGRYLLNKIGQFVYAAKQKNPRVKLQIFSKADRSVIEKELSESGLLNEDWQVEAVSYQDIPNRLSQCDVGVHFLQKGISEHTGSPTKIGEYWATGLPVVITPNMSDNDIVAANEEVGVVVNSHDDNSYLEAFEKIQKLLQESEIQLRCRKAAERHFALERACASQLELYLTLTKK